MRFNILIAGKAGQGIKGLADILSESLVRAGYYIFNYRDYQSLITGGHNFNVVSISEKPINSFDRKYDAALLFDELSLREHKDEFKKDCVILYDFDIKNIKPSKAIKLDSLKYNKSGNMVFLGALFKILKLNKTYSEIILKEKYSGELLKRDLEAVNFGYASQNVEKKLLRSRRQEKILYMTGTEAVGIGAIESGLNIYLAYPMTPATPLLNFLASNQKKYNYLTFEPENEIAVANASLGASFTGAKTMIGTSGGGFDLMTEAMSMQGMTELPLVANLVMRSGPSSGAATYTSQQDLNMALNCGHGDFPRIVMAPGDIKESYEKTKEAFYLSEKYGLLTIILTDKHLAENGYTQKIDFYDLFIKSKSKAVKEIIKANSYTHDEKGNYTEDPKIIKQMADKIKEKQRKAKKEIAKKFSCYEVYGKKNSKKVIAGFGSTKGAIKDSLAQLKDFKYIHIIYLDPFVDELKKELSKSSELFVIENNISGQLADLIQKEAQIKIPDKNRILIYNARPFTPNEIVTKLKKIQ